jgi:signal transduction histidine kinase
LIVNAINACGDTGSIVVSIGSPGGEAMFAVRDNGAGMSESVLAQLFVPFFTTKEAGKGTGLGLAVAHGIIKAHGGRIAVSSEVGKGTTFEVFLPTSPPAEAACPASS